MKITIRMDDITPGMDWGKFERFKAILDEYGIKPLIGVVPDNRDKKLSIDPDREDFWKYIRELQEEGYSVAMHGLTHVYTTKNPGMFPIGGKSEFAGLPMARQDEMIREGRRIFRSNGIVTDIFMAPSHSFDKNTLKVLKKNGFYIITDGFGDKPFRANDMIFYPISVQKSRSLKDEKDGIVTFVYHANSMNDRDFEKLKDLMETGKVVSYSEYKYVGIEERSVMQDVWQYTMAKAKYTVMQLKKRKG